MKVEPFSEPIINLVGIVVSKSSTVPPTIFPFLSGSISIDSVGSVNFLISHHRTWPSVEVEKNSEPKFDYEIT
jgi:hypothetical protein